MTDDRLACVTDVPLHKSVGMENRFRSSMPVVQGIGHARVAGIFAKQTIGAPEHGIGSYGGSTLVWVGGRDYHHGGGYDRT